MTTVLLIVIAVLLFSLIILSHEFGHFITAKLSGIRVNEFALGMGPKLLSFNKKETLYSLRLLPIGGFCAMEGEDEESDDVSAFGNKPVWQRIIVVAAGAIMNMLIGLLLVMIVLGQQDLLDTTVIARFTENSAMEAAGIEVGDKFYSIDGYRILSGQDINFALSLADPDHIDIQVKRNDELLTFSDIAFPTTEENGHRILRMDFYILGKPMRLGTLLGNTVKQTYSLVRMVWFSLIGMITGRFGLNDIAGPIGATQAITQAASAGLESGLREAINNILTIMSIITVNLGIVNLLPLPALDGGRLLFLILEAIRGKSINPKYEGWVHTAGFILLMLLMVVIAFNDIVRLITGHGLGG